jgi:hypothetical protein
MQGSIGRVLAVLRGEKPDRIPLYDLLRNDAVISHFGGEMVDVSNGRRLTYRAYEPAIDATRPLVRTPNAERTETDSDGLERRYFRWTIWVGPRRYGDAADYSRQKRAWLNSPDRCWSAQKQADLEAKLEGWRAENAELGEVYLFRVGPCEWLTNIYHEVGLEQFCYFLADMPDLIEELLDANFREAAEWADHLPDDHGLDAIFLADDIAFRSGTLLRPEWFKRHYYNRLARVCATFHSKGVRVLFHSDGNLYRILDGLVEAGIDGLNPIEVLAGMDVGEIHRRWPGLFLAGGIDVSHLLPFGTPREVRDAVRRAIEDAEGRILIGSSTELHDGVPLANFLAMREAVLDYNL